MIRGRKGLAALSIAITLLGISLIPIKAYGDDGLIVAAIYKVFDWMQNAMMQKFQEMEDAETNKITGKMWDIFQQQSQWERWPASLKELLTEQMVPYENQLNAVSYKNALSYVNYTQGSASGVNAAQYPVKALNHFNNDYDKVQQMNPQCNLEVPQAVGDTTNGCTSAQVSYTNTMLSGVNPLPQYPASTLNTAAGQQYTAEVKTNITRTDLSQLALDQSTNDGTNQFITYMQKSLQQPSIDQINAESSEAIARDALILEQARAMLELRQYESTLMNQRLLATLVAQNEEYHLDYIRKLAKAQAQALHQ